MQHANPISASTRLSVLASTFLLLFVLVGCTPDQESRSDTKTKPAQTSPLTKNKTQPAAPQTFVDYEVGHGLPPMKIPADNPMSDDRIELGELLFFDTALSVDHSMSCATCHDPQQGWSNGEPFAAGTSGIRGKRNVLSILNVGFYDEHLFWDGRVKTLEEQALVPVFEKTEMGMSSEEELIRRVQENEDYRRRFETAFEDGVTAENIAKALACFQRTVFVKQIPYERYLAGDKTAMSAAAVRGSKLFFNRRVANCGKCHPAPLFTDQLAYNIGIGMDAEEPDWGFHHTKGWGYWGKFRSPSLRGISQSGPYMHDGSLATLEDVVDYYDRGGNEHEYTDVAVTNLGLTRLTERQKSDLVAFLREGLADEETQ